MAAAVRRGKLTLAGAFDELVVLLQEVFGEEVYGALEA